MDIERMKQLADHLRSLGSNSQMGFDMWEWYGENALDWRGEECRTVACIAGHATILFGERINLGTPGYVVREKAKEYLDLTRNQANELFTPEWLSKRTMPPEEAADALERMIKGERPWTS